MKKGIPSVNLKKAKTNNIYTILHVCLFHHGLTTVQLIFKNREIKKIKKLSLRWDSSTQSLGFDTTDHLRNRMQKENCRKRLYS